MAEIGQRSFVERVRRGKLKAATQAGFSLEKWTSSYSGIESPSVSEKRLYDSGVWFAQKLDQIRDLLVSWEGVRIHGDCTVQAHVGAANWMILNDTLLHQDEIKSSLEGGVGGPGARVYWPGTYSNIQLASRLEGFVVPLRFPFGEAIRESRQPLEGEASEDIEALTKIRIRLQVGVVYDLLYYLWNECLWNDWYVYTSRDIDMVVPGDMELAVARAIGERRWAELVTELFIRIDLDWQRRTPAERAPFVSMPRVSELVQEGGQQRIVTAPGDAASPHAPIQLVTQVASMELYFGGLLSEELPNLSGVCINHLTSAWVALAPLADIVTDQFPELGYVDTLRQVLEYCPIFERSQLEDVLTTVM